MFVRITNTTVDAPLCLIFKLILQCCLSFVFNMHQIHITYSTVTDNLCVCVYFMIEGPSINDVKLTGVTESILVNNR